MISFDQFLAWDNSDSPLYCKGLTTKLLQSPQLLAYCLYIEMQLEKTAGFDKRELPYPGKNSNVSKGRPFEPNRLFFWTLFKRPLTPPPSFLNIYVADFSKGFLKKCINACRDKCVKIVRKSLGKMSNLPKSCDIFILNYWQFHPQKIFLCQFIWPNSLQNNTKSAT